MAGGDANDLRAPWPKGDDGVMVLEFGPVNIEASKASDHIFDTMTAPFAFRVIKGEVSSQTLTENTGITINLQDDSSTPQELVSDAGLSAIVAGAGGVTAVTVSKTITINAGALLYASYKSGSTDTSVQTKLRLWIKPVHG